MKRACLGYLGHRCGRLVEHGSRWVDCQRALYRYRDATRDPFARRVYGSGAWRKLRNAVIASAQSCFYCHRADVPLTVDHVVGVRLDHGRALDPTNVVPACRSCQEIRKHNPGWWGAARPRERR